MNNSDVPACPMSVSSAPRLSPDLWRGDLVRECEGLVREIGRLPREAAECIAKRTGGEGMGESND